MIPEDQLAADRHEEAAGDARQAIPGMLPFEGSGETLVPMAGEPPARSQWQLFLRRFLHHKLAVFSLFVLVLLMLTVTFAPHLAFYKPDPTPLPPGDAYHPPGIAHWFGTDELGRDVMTRLMYAGRVSLTVGLLVAIFSSIIGVTIGSIAGFFGGWADQFLMRLTDLFLIVPAIAIVAMAQKGLVGRTLPIVGKVSSTTLIVGILSFLFWRTIARLTRGLFMSLKETE